MENEKVEEKLDKIIDGLGLEDSWGEAFIAMGLIAIICVLGRFFNL